METYAESLGFTPINWEEVIKEYPICANFTLCVGRWETCKVGNLPVGITRYEKTTEDNKHVQHEPVDRRLFFLGCQLNTVVRHLYYREIGLSHPMEFYADIPTEEMKQEALTICALIDKRAHELLTEKQLENVFEQEEQLIELVCQD